MHFGVLDNIKGFRIGYILIFGFLGTFKGWPVRPVPTPGGEIGTVLRERDMFGLAGL